MVEPLVFKGGPHAVVLFHGLSSTPQELQITARGLSRAGYTVILPGIRTYTWARGDHGKPAWRQWVGDARRIYEQTVSRYESVSIGGLCIGAVLALQVAATSSAEPASVLCLSTTLHYDGWSLPWYRHFLPLAGWLPFGHRYRFKERWPWGVKDPRMRQWIEQQMAADGASAAGAAELGARHLLEARRLIRATRSRLQQVTAPTLVLHAVEDEVASPRSAEEVIRRVKAGRTRLVLLRDSYHMISLDREKQRVIDEIGGFLALLNPPRKDIESRRPKVVPIGRHGNI